MFGVEVFTLKAHQLGVHRQGFAPRQQIVAFYHHIADNLYFRSARCMLPKAGAGEQGGQGDDGQRGSIGEAVAL
jgi:hypothetical protein